MVLVSLEWRRGCASFACSLLVVTEAWFGLCLLSRRHPIQSSSKGVRFALYIGQVIIEIEDGADSASSRERSITRFRHLHKEVDGGERESGFVLSLTRLSKKSSSRSFWLQG